MKKIKRQSRRLGRIFRISLFIFVCGGIVWLSFVGVYSFLNNTSYFKVKRVSFVGLDEENIAKKISKQLMYDNIFGFNIASNARNIKRAYPQFYDVEIVRNLPDELMVKIIRRKPLAQIEHKGFFLIDSEGVIVSDASKHPFTDHIIIEGFREIGIPDLSFGKKIHSSEFSSGLKLAEMFTAHKESLISLLPDLISDTLIRIDLRLYPSIYVYVNTLELRFHSESLSQQFDSFFDVLPSLSNKIKQVKYVDLRFGDPAVSL